MIQQIVIETATGKVIKSGYCSFANDYNAETQSVIENDYNFTKMHLRNGYYTYNSQNQSFAWTDDVKPCCMEKIVSALLENEAITQEQYNDIAGIE